MRYLKLLLLCFLTPLIQGCPSSDDEEIIGYLKLENQTEKTIYSGIMHSEREMNSSDFRKFQIIEIPTKSNIRLQLYNSDSKRNLWVLIYKQSTLDTHSWEEIQIENLYDKRYSFTLEELKAMNWTIAYNGE